jgi:C_GCAxxG_C_C family probable redox protein
MIHPTYMAHDQNTKREEKRSVKQQSNQFPEKATRYFRQDYNCAQSVLLAMSKYYGVRRNRLIPKIATAFGAGIGRRGSLCGALTGGIMAIGLKHGNDNTVLKEKEKAYRIALRFYDQFAKECGSPFCRELIGYDLTNPEERDKLRKSKVRDEKCSHFVRKAVEILIDLEARQTLEQYQKR